MAFNKKVVIIGAGVVGCSIAYHLAKYGVYANVIDRDSIAARASGKSWATVPHPRNMLTFEGSQQNELLQVPQMGLRPFSDLYYIGWYRLPSVALEIQQAGIDFGLAERPLVLLARSKEEEGGLKAMFSSQKNEGHLETSWLDSGDLRKTWPDMNPEVRGGFCYPAYAFEPYKYVIGLVQVAEKHGANFGMGDATGFRSKGSKITSVTLASGNEIEGDVFVLATGPWINEGSRWLKKEVPVRINREQCLRLRLPENLPPYCLMAFVASRKSFIAIVPHANGDIVLGHGGHDDIQSDTNVEILTNEAKYSLLNDAVEILPGLAEAELVEHRGDFEGWSLPPNSMKPILGKMPDWDNAYVAANMATFGQIMSLGVGQCMADLIVSEGAVPFRIKNMMEVLSPALL